MFCVGVCVVGSLFQRSPRDSASATDASGAIVNPHLPGQASQAALGPVAVACGRFKFCSIANRNVTASPKAQLWNCMRVTVASGKGGQAAQLPM